MSETFGTPTSLSPTSQPSQSLSPAASACQCSQICCSPPVPYFSFLATISPFVSIWGWARSLGTQQDPCPFSHLKTLPWVPITPWMKSKLCINTYTVNFYWVFPLAPIYSLCFPVARKHLDSGFDSFGEDFLCALHRNSHALIVFENILWTASGRSLVGIACLWHALLLYDFFFFKSACPNSAKDS